MEFIDEYHARSFEQLFEGLPTSVVGICKNKIARYLNDYSGCTCLEETEYPWDWDVFQRPFEFIHNTGPIIAEFYQLLNMQYVLDHMYHNIGCVNPVDNDFSSRVTVHDLHDERALHVRTRCAFVVKRL